jgi:hypothetical protein
MKAAVYRFPDPYMPVNFAGLGLEYFGNYGEHWIVDLQSGIAEQVTRQEALALYRQVETRDKEGYRRLGV